MRTKNPYDNATPSGNSIGALVLLRLAVLTGHRVLSPQSGMTLGDVEGADRAISYGLLRKCCAPCIFFERPPLEVAVVGSAEERAPFLRAVNDRFQPNKVVTGWNQTEEAGADLIRLVPLLEGKSMPRKASSHTSAATQFCSSPVNTVDGLIDLLEESDDQPGGRSQRKKEEIIRVR